MERGDRVASLCIVTLLVSLFVGLVSGSSSDSPFLIVHKKVDLSRLKSGVERLSVSIDLYNQGSATAYDVSLDDDSWTKDLFDVVVGRSSKSWEQLDAGASVSHCFMLESKGKGIFYGAPAVVKFRAPSKAVLQEAYSTAIEPLDILAEQLPEQKFKWVLLAEYGSLVSVLLIVGLFAYVMMSPSRSGAVQSSKKRR
ncbi:Translocon-associated protein subunit beta [Nymphaea thermarum]|nr:Translocon-associated protein subunit beta [Nymphaea thermarum]